jgi:hypothetical protein
MFSIHKTIGLLTATALFSISAHAQTAGAIATNTNLVNEGVSQRVAVPSTTKIEGVELLEKIGRFEQDLIVYRAAKPTSADIAARFDSAKLFAKDAGVRFGEKLQKLGEQRIALVGADDASASFEVDQLTGNFLFESGLEKYGVEASTRDLPKNEALPELAIRTLKQYGLEVKPEELKVSHVGGLNMSVADGKNVPQIFEKLKTIRYSRVLDGLPVEGDSRIVAHFGEGAQLSGLVFQFPQIASARRLSPSLIQQPDALKKQALEEVTTRAKKALRAKLTKVDLVIYDDGRGVMEPAYHVVLERLLALGDKEPAMIPYDFYVPVSSKPAAFFPQHEVSLFLPEDGSSPEGGITGIAE